MSYASKLGRARVSARSPQAAAICDRCGFVYNHCDLRYQYDWAGAMLQNLRLLVCDRCYDTPQDQNRAIVIPADPVPIVNPRPQLYSPAETDWLTLTPSTTDPVTGLPIPNTTVMATVVTDDYNVDYASADYGTGQQVIGRPMSPQPVGSPTGYTQAAQAPLVAQAAYAVALPIVAILSSGGTAQVVTTATPHGLSSGSQVAIQGLVNTAATGTYSVALVLSVTQFTYQTNTVIPAGSLLGPRTLVTTMNIGIPLNMDQLPVTGS